MEHSLKIEIYDIMSKPVTVKKLPDIVSLCTVFFSFNLIEYVVLGLRWFLAEDRG